MKDDQPGPLIVDIQQGQVWMTVRGNQLITMNANYARAIGERLIQAADKLAEPGTPEGTQK